MNYLKEYQKHNGLKDDGVLGPTTAAFIGNDLNIRSNIKLAHFLGQCYHESKRFTAGRENLNYSAEGLLKTFGKRFNPSTAKEYARQPERIANFVYSNRMGNGNEASGDGWRYRGVGPIQLTGKTNILSYFNYAGLLEPASPDEILAPEHYFRSAMYFFDTNGVWKYTSSIEEKSILSVSRLINVGNATSSVTPVGIIERIFQTGKIYDMIKNSSR